MPKRASNPVKNSLPGLAPVIEHSAISFFPNLPYKRMKQQLSKPIRPNTGIIEAPAPKHLLQSMWEGAQDGQDAQEPVPNPHAKLAASEKM
ncbi:unnamed protein product [Linum trigynum]|uniref:Uncharacterized protein n=1 Tax=Linum trigynum TaxID=586398 RepID=A0AAV2CK76_9ROSI